VQLVTAKDRLTEKTLSLLMENSRLSFREIARKLKVSTTTISRVVKDLEDRGVIRGYTLRADWKKIGFDSVLCVQITTKPNAEVDSVGKDLREINQVKEIFYTTGDAGFSAYVVCKNTDDAASILKKLGNIHGVERVVSHMVLKVY
jgi:Lrp/AsnC family transcriptional regulator for asnA, asnC and gidA